MRRGFTLLELSVVLAIISVILGSGMVMLTASVQQSQYNNTVATMTTIEKALLDYSIAMKRLPCPSDLTLKPNNTNYGVEAANKGTCTGGTPAANYSSSSTVVEGGIPVRALQLSDSFMYDGWGRRFRYAVDPSYTYATGSNAGFPPPTDGICSSSASSITINDATGAARTTTAIYVIVSHGANGHGGFTTNGTVTNAKSNNTDEKENCHCSNVAAVGTNDAIYVQKAPVLNSANSLDSFDDIVTYKDAWQLNGSQAQKKVCGSGIWIADFANHRVLKFSTSGQWLMTIGDKNTSGSDNNHMINPVSVAVDRYGNVWVMDVGNNSLNRVVKYSPSGTWLMTIGGGAAEKCAGTYASPTSCNNISGHTQCCSPNDSSCTCSTGSADGQFSAWGNASQLTFDSSGYLWVTDSQNHRIQKFDPNTGAFLSKITASSPTQFDTTGYGSATVSPSGAVFDKNGYVWIVVPGNSFCSMNRCTTGGACTVFPGTGGGGGCGSATGKFQGGSANSNYMAIDASGNIWVDDEGNSRIQEFSSSTGTYMGVLPGGSYSNVTGIYFDSDGMAWVSNESSNVLYKINPTTGTKILTIGTGWPESYPSVVNFSSPQLSYFNAR